MAEKTIAERIYTAYLTGGEATFTENGITYSFTPEGLSSFISSGASEVSWNDITDKPSTFPPEIGTTSDTAKAGNYQPTWAQVTGKPTTFAPIIGTTSTTAMAGDTFIPDMTLGDPVADAIDETDVVAQFNALLASLRANGVLGT